MYRRASGRRIGFPGALQQPPIGQAHQDRVQRPGLQVVWLRISGLRGAYAFHASTHGEWWHLVRHFTLGQGVHAEVGFEVQSPLGDGCQATFTEIGYRAYSLDDLRDGR